VKVTLFLVGLQSAVDRVPCRIALAEAAQEEVLLRLRGALQLPEAIGVSVLV